QYRSCSPRALHFAAHLARECAATRLSPITSAPFAKASASIVVTSSIVCLSEIGPLPGYAALDCTLEHFAASHRQAAVFIGWPQPCFASSRDSSQSYGSWVTLPGLTNFCSKMRRQSLNRSANHDLPGG